MQNSSEDPRGGEKKFRRNLQSFDAAPSRSVVTRDLPFCCTSKYLQNFIAQHLGVPPIIAVVLRNPDGKTLQYGCALFETDEQATQAINVVHMKRLHGRDIRVLPYSSASLREVSRSGDVLISFISLSALVEPVTEQNIRNIVEEYGDINYISIRQHKFSKEGIQNGFGFVTMSSQESNQKVLENVKGIEVDNVRYTSEESNHVRRSAQRGVEESQVVEAGNSALDSFGLNSGDNTLSPATPLSDGASQIDGVNKVGEYTIPSSSRPSSAQASGFSSRPTSDKVPTLKRGNHREEGTLSVNLNNINHHAPQQSVHHIVENTATSVYPLMNMQPPRPYSPPTHAASSNSVNCQYIPMASNHRIPSAVGNTATTPVPVSPQLQPYPSPSTTPSQQYMSAFSSMPVYATTNQIPRNHYPHQPASQHHHQFHQMHTLHPQYSAAVNMTRVQQVPSPSGSTNLTYPYPLQAVEQTTAAPFVLGPYMPQPNMLPNSQSYISHMTTTSHQNHQNIPYMHLSVAPTGVNIPITPMMAISTGQTRTQSFPIATSVATNAPPYHVPFSAATFPHHLSRQPQHSHNQQTFYQQQSHQSSTFVSVSSNLPQITSHHSYSHSQNHHSHSTHHDQQRR